MPEPFDGPPEAKAPEFERNSTSKPDASPFSGDPNLAAFHAIQQRLRSEQPVRSVGDQFETSDHQPSAGHRDVRAGTLPGVGRRYDEALRSDRRRRAYRWALLTLAVVVVIQSAFLMIGFRSSVEETPQPDTSADEQVRTPSAQSVNWQAARAGDPRAPGAATGAVSIPLPFQVEIYEDDRFIGLNAGAGIRLRPGSHRLTLVNESLGYRATQTVNVSSGRTTTLTPSLPTGMLQLNATPWAEVLLDGKSLGETPLANVPVSIGQHTLIFRHPELGQQSRSAIVTAQSSTRVTVDLQKQ